MRQLLTELEAWPVERGRALQQQYNQTRKNHAIACDAVTLHSTMIPSALGWMTRAFLIFCSILTLCCVVCVWCVVCVGGGGEREGGGESESE